MSPLTVLFLCTGNTCRSPLAEALARHRFGEERARFLSAGLQAWPGQPASPGSLRAAAERGADLGRHRSRALTPHLLAGVDWVVAMTRAHAALFRQDHPDFSGRVSLLSTPGRDLAAETVLPAVEEVADPFGGPAERYETMAGQIERLLEGWRDLLAVAGGRAKE